MKKISLIILSAILLIARPALAHCPLCTIGAGAAAGLAAYLGISPASIGLFIGAFAIALGLWISRLVKKKYIPYQKTVITGVSFFSTVLPLIPLVPGYTSLPMFITGSYGSLLNKTYLINLFLLGSLLGGIIILISPTLSRALSKARKNKLIPYQGIIITFTLLILIGMIIEITI